MRAVMSMGAVVGGRKESVLMKSGGIQLGWVELDAICRRWIQLI